MQTTQMAPDELQGAVERVLDAAGFRVEPNAQIHGTEIDILATRRGSAIPEIYCVECTTAHVDAEKYGKDIAHFALLREQDPGIRCIIVSTGGFAGPTLERAKKTRVFCWTYDEFRSKFIATVAYEHLVLGPDEHRGKQRQAPADPSVPEYWRELEDLQTVYQEPTLLFRAREDDKPQSARALEWFDRWLAEPKRDWVSLIGDYGTGKTALTKVLQRRWMEKWRVDGQFLPIRIELRDFATKFDFEGLLIHFWKSYQLDDMPFRALEMLVREGRVVFILDGYDEMAQNLSLMDRRNCLVAIAKALSSSSTGIVTSRPNYFTEAEELNVVEILYRRKGGYHRLDRQAAIAESEIDQFLSQYYYARHEARLLDLTPQQIERLITIRLADQPEFLENVQGILERVYSVDGQPKDPERRNLGTKPVVVTYLLEVAENLGGAKVADYEPLDDWGIFRLILDKLVLRDQKRTTGLVAPSERRLFLQRLAIDMSVSKKTRFRKPDMLQHVHQMFGREIRRHGEYEAAAQEEIYFSDLRTSASLTSDRTEDTWFFSHNSLREFLLAEAIIEVLLDTSALPTEARSRLLQDLIKISPTQGVVNFLQASFNHFPQLKARVISAAVKHRESVLAFFVPVVVAHATREVGEALREVIPSGSLDGVPLSDLRLVGETLEGWNFSNSFFDRTQFRNVQFSDCRFENLDIGDSSFEFCVFRDCCFKRVDLRSVTFAGSTFHNTTFHDEALHRIGLPEQVVDDDDAASYLRYRGAIIREGRHLNVLQYHKRWPDFLKLITQLTADLGWRQSLGLTKKGGVKDAKWARKLVKELVALDLCEEQKRNNKMVRVNSEKLDEFDALLDGRVPDRVRYLFE